MCPLTPVGGAEGQDGEGQSQSGQGQGEQGARTARHVLQHGQTGEDPEAWRGERDGSNRTEGETRVPEGAEWAGQMLWWGFMS